MINVDVFISYSSKNKTVADAVVSNFEQNGIRCWYAPRDILPGKEWVAAIKEGIYSAKVFILLFTEESNASRQVMNEVAMAFNAEKTIVPFKLTKEEMSDELEYYLTRVHWLDAVSQPLNDHIEELRGYVGMILNGSEPRTAVNRETVAKEGSISPDTGDAPKKRRWILPAGIVAVLALAAIIFLIIRPFGSGKNTGTGDGKEEKQEAYAAAKEQGEAYYQAGDYDKALASFLKALDDGDTTTSTYYRLGTIYRSGKTAGGADEEKGLQYLELAYNDGNGEKLTADEYYLLAYKYDSDAATKNPEKVCRFALAGAEAGSVPCMMLLGEAYWYGNGVEQDYEQVLKWFGKALDCGAEGYTRNYCLNVITTLVEEGHVTREAASRWLGEQ